MYNFRMPIGDWSDDGHGKCTYYTVSSDLPVEDVREAHFAIYEKTGLDIGSICSEYEESSITTELFNDLVILGLDIREFDYPHEGEVEVSPEGMCHIWITLLNHVEPRLNLKKMEDLPMLPFYGYDNKKRHINQVGYGCY